MRHKYKCTICGATGWARGWSEDDINAAGLDDNDPLEDACEHINAGGDYTLIDTEYDDNE
jgi:hypothetical protein